MVRLIQPHVFGSANAGMLPETMALDAGRLDQFRFEMNRVAFLAALLAVQSQWPGVTLARAIGRSMLARGLIWLQCCCKPCGSQSTRRSTA